MMSLALFWDLWVLAGTVPLMVMLKMVGLVSRMLCKSCVKQAHRV